MRRIYICKKENFGKYVGIIILQGKKTKIEYVDCFECLELHPISETEDYIVGDETYEEIMSQYES